MKQSFGVKTSLRQEDYEILNAIADAVRSEGIVPCRLRVEMVVSYKDDRLSMSKPDFGRLIRLVKRALRDLGIAPRVYVMGSVFERSMTPCIEVELEDMS